MTCADLQRLLHGLSELGLLTRVVDADLQVDLVEDFSHFVLQAVQLSSFSLQLPLVLLVAQLQLCENQDSQERLGINREVCLTVSTSIQSFKDPLKGNVFNLIF